MSKIGINRTHLCVLRKRENKEEIYVDYIELKFPYDDLLQELKNMVSNPNRHFYELENFIKSNPLKELLGAFPSYCRILSDPWQDDPIKNPIVQNYESYPLEHYIKTLHGLDEKIKKEPNEFKQKIITDKTNFIEYVRKNVWINISERKIAYILENAYKNFNPKINSNILAHSHRYIGYSFPEFSCLGSDFHVKYNTNFGYGSVSFFYSNIRYKNIDLLFYRDWIYYQFAKTNTILQYTRKHNLCNESWLEAMELTIEIYNKSISNPKKFVENWILNECEEMVSGLENLLKNSEKIKENFHGKFFSCLKGWELISFKGNKASGALSLLRKIKEQCAELKIEDNANRIIERVMNCNQYIHKELTEGVVNLKNEIDSLNEELKNKIIPNEKKIIEYIKFVENAVKEKAEIQANLSDTKQQIQKILEIKQEKTSEIELLQPSEIRTKFIFAITPILIDENYTEYYGMNTNLRSLIYHKSEINRKIQTLNNHLVEFNDYKSTIEKYFETVDRIKELQIA